MVNHGCLPFHVAGIGKQFICGCNVQVLRQPGNVLLLDEPTNDLDVDTLRALEQALLKFAGECLHLLLTSFTISWQSASLIARS